MANRVKYIDRKKIIVQYLNDNKTITTDDMIEHFHISRRTARQVLTKMVKCGVLNRHFNLNDTRRKFYTLKMEAPKIG